MFGFLLRRRSVQKSRPSAPPVVLPRRLLSFDLESLEGRRFLSAVLDAAACEAVTGATTTADSASLNSVATPAVSSIRYLAATTSTATATAGTTKITFADAPAAVQSGMSALAQGVTIPSTQVVKQFTRRDGTTVYSTSLAVNGRRSRITVDSDGNPLEGKIAFSAAPTVVQTGLQAQLSTVTIADDQVVTIRERHGGTVVYSTSVNTGGRAKTVAVDVAGTAVTKSGRTLTGGTTVLFNDASAAIQDGLQALAQGQAIGSDQVIDQLTLPNGTVIYSALISIDGEATRIAVAADGTALEGEIQFGDAPAAVQTGLQTLATGGTIPDTQLVRIRTRPGATATSIYSTTVELNNTATTIAVNQDGTAVTIFGGGDFGHGHDHGGGGFDGHGGGVADRTTVDYSTIPSAAQIGLQKLATGVTLPDTQQIDQATLADGTVVYSTVVTINGRLVRIAVDASGSFRNGEITFADAPTVVQTALQALAGTTALLDTQTVRIDTERDGTTVYSTGVTLNGVATRIAVDSIGATVSTGGFDGHGGRGGGFGGGGRHGGFRR
jgi:hypothetical protein